MKIWLDILSPKQLFLFTSVAERLRKLGYEPLMTSRSYVQLDGLIEGAFKGWNIVRVGRWGGGSLEGKLRASIERMSLLLDLVLSENPSLCISSGSPEASRIAYGLGMPHLLISDTPHSPVNKLAAPISERILTPWVIPVAEWVRAGASRGRVKRYKALDPCFWLRGFKPDEAALRELELEKRGYILFRMPETQAAYLSADDEAFLKAAGKISEDLEGLKLVISCRYREQAEKAERMLRGLSRVRILDRLFPGASITYYSALFIGGGGTMTQEAALLGVPTISIYPGKLPAVHEYLRRRGLIIHCGRLERLPGVVKRILGSVDDVRRKWGERSGKLWRIMEDPFDLLLREIRKLSAASS
ncbi:MAG TPA: DUF354 domain-containing protein [Nitrososphaeria archaeon]|nr:DUF354 domain-containing protein [Nitrososphaeria archaeon]